ncbi:hypothetical protein BBP40_002097 [Aspergillus hancockii]|nr:hypothetical protein BBP40_002097 [Aspergillus hancockii]
MDRFTRTVSELMLNEALKPVSGFDWAEDVEDTLQQLQFLKLTANFDWVDDLDEILKQYVEFETDSSSESDSDIAPEMNDFFSRMISTGKKSLMMESVTPPTSDHDFTDKEDRELAQIEKEVKREFDFRNYCAREEGGAVHHLNWLGCLVYQPSGTPAAISLLFQLADPKIPKTEDEFRLKSIMNRAMTFIDPVIVELENSPEDLYRQGFDLVRFATGRAHKFYSPHGWWIADQLELSEDTIPDMGNVIEYQTESMTSGNGFVSHCSIRSRDRWERDRVELQARVLNHLVPMPGASIKKCKTKLTSLLY